MTQPVNPVEAPLTAGIPKPQTEFRVKHANDIEASSSRQVEPKVVTKDEDGKDGTLEETGDSPETHRIDGGWRAWITVAAGFLMIAICLGHSNAYGVYLVCQSDASSMRARLMGFYGISRPSTFDVAKRWPSCLIAHEDG